MKSKIDSKSYKIEDMVSNYISMLCKTRFAPEVYSTLFDNVSSILKEFDPIFDVEMLAKKDRVGTIRSPA